MGKLKLSAKETEVSLPLTGFSTGEWENPQARKLHFYGIFSPRL